MADIPISYLPAAATITSASLVPTVNSGVTEKATCDQLLDGLPDVTTSSRGVMTAAQATLLANATDSNAVSTLVKRDSSGDFAAHNITANLVTGLATPTNASDAANKAYVDSATLISVPNLAAINADLGTITAGSLTASASVTVASGGSAVSITSTGLTIAAGRISFVGDGANPRQRVFGNGAYSGTYFELNGQTDPLPPYLALINGSGSMVTITPTGGIALAQSLPMRFGAGSRLVKTTSDSWGPLYNDGTHDLEFQWDGSDLRVRIDQSTVKTITTT